MANMKIYQYKTDYLDPLPNYATNPQISPSSLLYTGGYTKSMTKCDKCQSTGYLYDQHFIDCCKLCGGNISRLNESYVWIAPVYEKVNKTLWFITYAVNTDIILRNGYWQKCKMAL